MSPDRFYGTPPPGVDAEELSGKLIVLEGADGSGRSTQMRILTDWLEAAGHATVNVGLKRSTLVSSELARAQEGNVLGRTTLSLFYATDFADQLENVMIPALRAGFVVLADRYIYTLMARDLVRGARRDWVESMYGIALVPDVVFYLRVSPRNLVHRNLEKNMGLNYWESGMDIGFSRDRFDSFVSYQKALNKELMGCAERFGFEIVNGNASITSVGRRIRAAVESLFSNDAA